MLRVLRGPWNGSVSPRIAVSRHDRDRAADEVAVLLQPEHESPVHLDPAVSARLELLEREVRRALPALIDRGLQRLLGLLARVAVDEQAPEREAALEVLDCIVRVPPPG